MTTPMPPAPGGQPTAPQNGMGTAALVMGILQFVCLGPIASILAIIFGKIGMTKADQGLATNRSSAQWGFWLGIVGLVLSILGLIFWILFFVIAASSGNLEVTTS